MTFTRDELAVRALLVLEQACDELKDRREGVDPGPALRFTLAYLFSLTDGRHRYPFDELWRQLKRPVGPSDPAAFLGRGATAHSCLAGIYSIVGIERTSDMMFAHRRKRPG